jgi:hypothetical protein
MLPAIAQKLPILEVIKHKDEQTNKPQPIRFRDLLLIVVDLHLLIRHYGMIGIQKTRDSP